MSVEINNESGIAVDESSLQRLITFALDLLHVNADAEVAIVDGAAARPVDGRAGPHGCAQLPDG
jgi:hypothetical protein